MIYPFRSIVYNCKQATLLSIKKAEGKISSLEAVKLQYHLMFCDPCRRFIQQWEMLDGSKKQLVDFPLFKLSEEARSRIQRHLIIGLLFFITSMPVIAQTQLNLEDGLAIEGYDPVAYFVSMKPVKGKKDLQYQHGGATYYFSTLANRDAFIKNPAAYEPQYGGWCAYAMGASGEKVEIDPETFKVADNKLYLFYNAYFNNTLPKWNKDEKNLKSKADQNWKAILNK